MRRLLITGITGFTGKYLSAAFSESGYEVYGTTLQSTAEFSNIFKVDLCHFDALNEVITKISPEIIIHLAAVSFVGNNNIKAMYQTNIVGTRNLLLALSALKTPPKSILLTSSANIYGNTVDNHPINESTLPNPENDYAVSKLAMEYMARLWLNKLPLFIVRPFNYTGIGQSSKFLLPKIIDHFCRGAQEIELGNIDISRDFTDVRTVVAVYKKLITLSPIGKTINICSKNSINIKEILQTMTDIAGYQIKVKINPNFIRKNEVKCLYGSNQLLTSLIGKIDSIPLKTTLLWMYQEGLHKYTANP